MIARNSNSLPPPTTMMVQTMVIGPQANIVNGEGGGGILKFLKSLRINFHDCL